MTALVGDSGSGKSTAIQLLLRLYDPAAGAVLLDGRDLRTLPLRWLRSQVGLVAQAPTLFAATIHENIALDSGASSEAVVAAALAANAHGFITRLPDGCGLSGQGVGRGASSCTASHAGSQPTSSRLPACLPTHLPRPPARPPAATTRWWARAGAT